MQQWHNDFAVSLGELVGYSFTATGKMSTHLYVTQGFHLYIRYTGARENLLREALVMEEVEIRRASFL